MNSSSDVVVTERRFRRGACPNLDALENVDERITQEECLNSCSISVNECNRALNTNVPIRHTCNKICSDAAQVQLPNSNIVCNSGTGCGQCCIRKCTITGNTIDMDCFVKCIDDVCSEVVVTTQPTSSNTNTNTTTTTTTTVPDTVYPTQIPIDTNLGKYNEENEHGTTYIVVIIILSLLLFGLFIFLIRYYNMSRIKRFFTPAVATRNYQPPAIRRNYRPAAAIGRNYTPAIRRNYQQIRTY